MRKASIITVAVALACLAPAAGRALDIAKLTRYCANNMDYETCTVDPVYGDIVVRALSDDGHADKTCEQWLSRETIRAAGVMVYVRYGRQFLAACGQPDTATLEKQLSDYLAVPHAICESSSWRCDFINAQSWFDAHANEPFIARISKMCQEFDKPLVCMIWVLWFH
jgi:hypothetical protein